MDDHTKTMMLSLATGVIKKGLITLGATAATHGIINGSQTETFVSLGMFAVGILWSLWNDYGRAIVLSQLEVLKAKSLAQAAKLNQAGIAPVTTGQIAAQSPTLTAAEVAKTVATLPPAIQANVADAAGGVLLLAVLILGALAFPVDASAQIKRPQITGNVVADTRANLGIGGAGPSSGPLVNILGALDDAMLPDLQYALKMATAADSKVTAPCFQAWIDIINKRKVAVTNSDGSPMDLPNPRLFTDFEKAVELRNALQPGSDFMLKCSPVITMVKLDVLSFLGKVIGGGAGLATLVPGL
jgi:hypothetical protein